MTIMDGQCACGATRFRVTRRPIFVHACHCRYCQRETGTAFAQNAILEASAVELLAGDVDEVLTPSESGKGQIICRCRACKSAVWSIYAGAGPKFRFVRVGALEHPGAFPPDIHIYTTSKQPWVEIPEGAAAVPEYYDAREMWPAESLERFRAAKNAS